MPVTTCRVFKCSFTAEKVSQLKDHLQSPRHITRAEKPKENPIIAAFSSIMLIQPLVEASLLAICLGVGQRALSSILDLLEKYTPLPSSWREDYGFEFAGLSVRSVCAKVWESTVFSLMFNESTDIGTSKRLKLLVSYWSKEKRIVACDLLEFIESQSTLLNRYAQ